MVIFDLQRSSQQEAFLDRFICKTCLDSIANDFYPAIQPLQLPGKSQECTEQPIGLESLKLITLRLLSYPYYRDYSPPAHYLYGCRPG